MARGRGFSSRGGYRGGGRGGPSWGGGYGEGRFAVDQRDSYDPRSKYGADRFSSRSHPDDYHKNYRMDSYMEREGGRRSPERKRMRMEGSSSRHDSSYNSGYGSSRHEPPSSYSERRGYSGERHGPSAPYRKEEFHRSSGPSPRGSYRGRLSSRGSRGLRARDRPGRRRLLESSYGIRRRVISRRTDFRRVRAQTRLRRIVRKPRDDSEKEETTDVIKEIEDSDVKKENEDGDEVKEGEEAKGIEKSKEARMSLDEKATKMGYIKLQCPHCNVKCLTFLSYERHLSSRVHRLAMRKLAIKHKSILIQMRQAQRKSQNELEKETSDELAEITKYCTLCKLNFKQKRSVHQLSEAHINMKKYLLPFCKICDMAFRSPMAFESHISAIRHMKRKHRADNPATVGSADGNDLENFTTIDSVGEGDEEGATEKKEIVNVGIDMIKKIESHYCDLCKMYLPRVDPEEMPKILTKHCKLRSHMTRYIRKKEREQLAKRAELLQKLESVEKKEGDNNPDVNGDDSMKEGAKEGEEGADDKLWADVDKDLGDILAEAESGNKSSDEDEDSHVNGERYDRFKLSEKNDDDKLMKEDEESILDNNPDLKETVTEG